jgi:hypothetical protein
MPGDVIGVGDPALAARIQSTAPPSTSGAKLGVLHFLPFLFSKGLNIQEKHM